MAYETGYSCHGKLLCQRLGITAGFIYAMQNRALSCLFFKKKGFITLGTVFGDRPVPGSKPAFWKTAATEENLPLF